MAEDQTTIRLSCPDELTLNHFVNGQLATDHDARVAQHVESCPACRRLLDQLQGRLPSKLNPALTIGADGNDPPPRLGGYELLGRLDAGGMGVVWRVRDLTFGRDLALKVMKARQCGVPGQERRFLGEARICGRLTHPFIVPVHALGRLEDGRPYYLMKLVAGQTLATLLQGRAPPGERLMERLQVFAQVCQAVGYAHSQGVVHRDLKPSNVMVGAHGEVQVMDWGLAKVLTGSDASPAEPVEASGTPGETLHEAGDHTDPGTVLGTWAYMPPEQARGLVSEVDQRSDVFGLGTILCEILTGQPPYLGSDARSLALQATEARLDGALARLRGCGADAELIRLAERCLAPTKCDRPADAAEVEAAVASYQAAVQERLQQERLEREREQVKAVEERRRRRVRMAAAVCVSLALALGVVASVMFALGERRARQEATHQALMAGESLFILEDVLSQADPNSEPKRNITLRQAVDRTTEKLNRGDLNGKLKTPESNAQVRVTLGKIYFNLGEYQLSHDLFAEAHRIASEQLGQTHPTAMTALDQLGKAYIFLGEFANAEQVLTKAYELQREVLGPEHEDTIHSLAKLATVYGNTGLLDRALDIENKVLDVRRRKWGDEYEFTLVSLNNLGLLYRDLARPEEALPLFEEAERIAKRTLGEQHSSTLTYLHNRALVCMDLKRWPEAQRLHSECLARKRRILGENHLSTLQTESNMAAVILELGKPDEARKRLESILGRLGGGIAQDHPFRGIVLVRIGKCFTALEKYQEAEQTLRQAQALLLKKVGPKHRFSGAAAEALKELLDRKNRPGTKTDKPNENPRP
jgi:serine/threonine protein kinase